MILKQIWLVMKSLVSRQWILATMLVIVGMILLARLGIWQLDRLAQRRAWNAALSAALESAPLSLNEETLPADVTALKDRSVTVTGVYDLGHQGIVKLQNYQGRPGVYLLAPLLIEGSETAVLVNRGWIPEREKENRSQYDQIGPVTITGYIGLTQTLSRQTAVSSSSQPQNEWFRVDIEAIQTQMPVTLLPIYVIEQTADGSGSDLPIPLEREIDLSEGPHLGYAIQWFIFSSMLGVGYLFYVGKQVGKKETN